MSIRIKCTCGARFKAPDAYAGKSVRCSVCGSAVLIPATNTTGVALKANQETASWIRTTCGCGKSIKAPPEWAGKTGNCPRCGADILMPGPTTATADARPLPTPKPEPATAPTDEHPDDQNTPGRNLRLSGLLDLTHREEVKIVDGIPAKVWEGRRDQRAKNIAAGASGQVRYYRQSSVFEHLANYRIRWAPFLYKHPAASTVVSLLVLAASSTFLYHNVTKKEEPLPQWIVPPTMTYFYDLETDEVFTHEISDPPPVLSPKQAANEKPRGVRAYIFSCSECVPGKWFIAYLETFNPTTRESWQRRIAARKVASIPAPYEDDTVASKTGRFLASPDDEEFIPLGQDEAHKILERAYKPCPDGSAPALCFPK